MTPLQTFIQAGLPGAFSFDEYVAESNLQAAEGRTSGDHTDPAYAQYTKLNDARLRRLTKQAELSDGLTQAIKAVDQPLTLLCITETWCGDAIQILPLLNLIAAQNETISLQLVWRDQEPFLIDSFLTRGGKSIPVVLAVSESGDALFKWGPRPAPLQAIYDTWRNAPEPKDPYAKFSAEIQRWYLKDKGQTFQQELGTLFETIAG